MTDLIDPGFISSFLRTQQTRLESLEHEMTLLRNKFCHRKPMETAKMSLTSPSRSLSQDSSLDFCGNSNNLDDDVDRLDELEILYEQIRGQHCLFKRKLLDFANVSLDLQKPAGDNANFPSEVVRFSDAFTSTCNCCANSGENSPKDVSAGANLDYEEITNCYESADILDIDETIRLNPASPTPTANKLSSQGQFEPELRLMSNPMESFTASPNSAKPIANVSPNSQVSSSKEPANAKPSIDSHHLYVNYGPATPTASISTQTDPLSEEEVDVEEDDDEIQLMVLQDHHFSNHFRPAAIVEPLSSCSKRMAFENVSTGQESFRRELFISSLEQEMEKLEMIADGFIDQVDEDADDLVDVECVRKHLENVQYEEVQLQRGDCKTRLGLTLCYGNGDNMDTDIFVSEVEPNGIAAMNGRIKPGDQILQINGVDVHTRNQAIALFGQSTKEITLLLARSLTDKAYENEHFATLNDIAEERMESAMTNMTINEEDEENAALTDGNRGSSSQGHEKDSGISHDTDSDPEPEPDPLPPAILVPKSGSKYSMQSSMASNARSPCSGNELSSAVTLGPAASSISPMSTDRSPGYPGFNSLLHLASPYSVVPSEPAAPRLYRSESEGSLARELASLQKEMNFIQLECDRLIEQHVQAERRVRQQVQNANNLVANLDSGVFGNVSPIVLGSAAKIQRTLRANLPGASAHPKPSRGQTSIDIGRSSKASPPPQSTTQVQLKAVGDKCQVSPPVASVTASPLSRTGSGGETKSPRSREESSSAYNTGAESCRSTPKNNHKPTQLQVSSNVSKCTVIANEFAAGKRDSACYTLPQNYDYIISPTPPTVIELPPKSSAKPPRGDKSSCTTPKLCQKSSAIVLPGQNNSANGKAPISNHVVRNSASPPNQRIISEPSPQSKSRSPGNRGQVTAGGKHSKSPGATGQLRKSPKIDSIPGASLLSVGDVMYTSPAYLQQTIALQQRLLRQAMIQQAQELKRQKKLSPSVMSTSLTYEDPDKLFNGNNMAGVMFTTTGGDTKVEWKVKRRADGTRYITKRPVRNKMLRQRAQQLVSERCGLSTDDDTMSELKLGRHWNKEERRKHFDSARERKRRQEEVIRRKLEAQLKTVTDQNQIVELSQKKMAKRRGHPLLDQFTTTQEFLAHGQRNVEMNRAMGFLSVTTV